MLRELFANKSLIAALIGCGLVIVGIHFWSQHEHSKLRQDEAATRQFIQQVTEEKKAATTRVEELSVVSQPHEVKRDAQAAHDNFAGDTDDGIPEVDTATKAIEVETFVEEELVAHEEPPAPLYPPSDWRKALDPALYAEYYYAQLLKQFGDVPDIETLADSLAVGKYKLKAQIPMTIDEAIAHAEASNTLWPSESTQRSIENLHEIKAAGRPYNPTYGPRLRPPPDPVEHLKPILTSLTREYGAVEGLRVLNTFDPQAAMEVKRAMIQDAETVGATTPGYYESKMKLIEQIFGDSDL